MSKMNLRFNPERRFRITRDEISNITAIDDVISVRSLRNKRVVRKRLDILLNPLDGIIDGDAVKDLIFPTDDTKFTKFDVFISHSHNDRHAAEALARYLGSIGQEPFLDNYVWSSADGLLNEIDKKWCKTDDGKDFDYNKRNFSTSHVHTMLSMAILEMIARCESFIFIDSYESLDYSEFEKTGDWTMSPWLYQELQYVRMLLTVQQPIVEQREFSDIRDSLKIKYGADLTDFIELTSSNIDVYFNKYKRRLS